MNELKEKLSNIFDVISAERIVDEEYRVDIEIKKDNEVIMGIQVKPSSYKYMRDEVKNFNSIRNANYKKMLNICIMMMLRIL